MAGWYERAYAPLIREATRRHGGSAVCLRALKTMERAHREEVWARAHDVEPQRSVPPLDGSPVPGHEGCEVCAGLASGFGWQDAFEQVFDGTDAGG